MICAIIVKSINFGRLYQSYRIKIFLEGMKLTLKSMWFFYIANQNQLDSLFITSILRATLHRFPFLFSLCIPEFKYHPRKIHSINRYYQWQHLQRTINIFHSKTICISFKSIEFHWSLPRAFISPSRQRQGCIIWETTRRCNMTT